jgi:hypothetical protein
MDATTYNRRGKARPAPRLTHSAAAYTQRRGLHTRPQLETQILHLELDRFTFVEGAVELLFRTLETFFADTVLRDFVAAAF